MIKLNWCKWAVVVLLSCLTGALFSILLWYFFPIFSILVNIVSLGMIQEAELQITKIILTVGVWIVGFMYSFYNCYQAFKESDKKGEKGAKNFFMNMIN